MNLFERKSYIKNCLFDKAEYKTKEYIRFLENSIKEINTDYYKNNSYFNYVQNIKIDSNCWSVEMCQIKALEPFVCGDNIAAGPYLKIQSKIGYSLVDYKYPSIKLYDREWMSFHPNEIETMKISSACVKGRVLVLGLGFGYFLSLIASKKDVKEITVIEMDKDLIEIYEKQLRFGIENNEKIKVIKDDAFEYIKGIYDGQFDFIFADLWHDVGDGLQMYIELSKALKDFKYTRCHYWIEDSLLSYFRLLVIGVIRDEFYCENYDYEIVQAAIKTCYKNMSFSSSEDVLKTLRIGELKKLIIKISDFL